MTMLPLKILGYADSLSRSILVIIIFEKSYIREKWNTRV